MTTFIKIFQVSDCDDIDLIKRKLPNTEHLKFVLDLNDELCLLLPPELNKYFVPKVISRTAKNVFSQLSIRGLIHSNHTRVDSVESDSIIKSILKKSDPSIQILKDHLSLEVFNSISALICTKNLNTPPSSLLTIKLSLSC